MVGDPTVDTYIFDYTFDPLSGIIIFTGTFGSGETTEELQGSYSEIRRGGKLVNKMVDIPLGGSVYVYCDINGENLRPLAGYSYANDDNSITITFGENGTYSFKNGEEESSGNYVVYGERFVVLSDCYNEEFEISSYESGYSTITISDSYGLNDVLNKQ